MSRIYTRTGDDGQTGIANAERLDKTATLIGAIGDVDELNSVLGLLRSFGLKESVEQQLSVIQHKLFDLGASLAQYREQMTVADDVDILEQWIDEMELSLPRLQKFILPAGNQVGSYAHLSRAICRRAERSCLQAANSYSIDHNCLKYLNRLSDYLFVLARSLNSKQEVFWQGKTRLTEPT